jgi:Protein of unknown function (DUF3987)
MSSPDDRDPWLEMRQVDSALQKAATFTVMNGQAEPVVADWPDPVDLLGQSVEAAAPFPVDFLPGALQDLAGDTADRMQCPVDFIGIPLIIAAATLIGKDLRLAPKALDDWSERPCLWGGLISGPATLKSPGFYAALAPIRKFQGEFREEYKTASADHAASIERAQSAEEMWKAKRKQALKAGEAIAERPEAARVPDPPKRRRLLTGDVTQEALADLMEQNPRGMLLFRDELSAWFASFNQYRPGSDRQFFLECHSGGAFMKDRRTGGSAMIDDLYLNICGGIQPDIVAKVLAGGDLDGMAARFSLLVWPDPMSEFRYVDRSPDTRAQRGTEETLRSLLKLDPERFFGPFQPEGRGLFRFDEAAQRIFKEWYSVNQVALRSGIYEGAGLQAHIGKYPGAFARLAIVHHLLRYVQENARNPTLVDDTTAAAVEGFLTNYLEPHARRIYRHLSQDPARKGARRIAEWIAADRATQTFTSRTIRQKDWSGLTEPDCVNRALDHLENVAGWIRGHEDRPGPKGGRPTVRHEINPLVRRGQFRRF